MLREKLSEEKKKEYDEIMAKIMKEIERDLEKIPPQPKNQLDGSRSKVYREVVNRYLPEIRKILGN